MKLTIGLRLTNTYHVQVQLVSSGDACIDYFLVSFDEGGSTLQTALELIGHSPTFSQIRTISILAKSCSGLSFPRAFNIELLCKDSSMQAFTQVQNSVVLELCQGKILRDCILYVHEPSTVKRYPRVQVWREAAEFVAMRRNLR